MTAADRSDFETPTDESAPKDARSAVGQPLYTNIRRECGLIPTNRLSGRGRAGLSSKESGRSRSDDEIEITEHRSAPRSTLRNTPDADAHIAELRRPATMISNLLCY